LNPPMPPPGLLRIRRWPAACKESPGHEPCTRQCIHDPHLLAECLPPVKILLTDRGSWIVDRGSWIVDRGSWIVDRGSWIVALLFTPHRVLGLRLRRVRSLRLRRVLSPWSLVLGRS
jgi:hypothetical protein